MASNPPLVVEVKSLDYLPPMIIGDDARFSDPTFIRIVGDLAQGH
jgi:branched-chain amino acid transport system substrate-binding protein